MPSSSALVPPVPGLPTPANNSELPNFSDLVTLESFDITSEDDTIRISANATAINPVPLDLEFVSPPLPFIIALPSPDSSSVPVASVHSHPFALTHPNISFTVDGTVVPLANNASGALSVFVSEYISGRDADIQITTPLLPNLIVNTTFPAPRPKPEILQNVSITDMHIKPVGTMMVASGTVHALVVLPRGIHVGVNASRVFPDVLVFDGAVPSPGTNDSDTDSTGGKHSDPPPTQPLPDPLPAHAFAHIIPEDWLPAECVSVEGQEGSGSTVAVTAHIVDVPLEVLPGREREFSNFVSKVRAFLPSLRVPSLTSGSYVRSGNLRHAGRACGRAGRSSGRRARERAAVRQRARRRDGADGSPVPGECTDREEGRTWRTGLILLHRTCLYITPTLAVTPASLLDTIFLDTIAFGKWQK